MALNLIGHEVESEPEITVRMVEMTLSTRGDISTHAADPDI